MKGDSVKLVKGTPRYLAAVQLFGQEYVDAILERYEDGKSELDALAFGWKQLATGDLIERLTVVRDSMSDLIEAASPPEPDAEPDEEAEADGKQFSQYTAHLGAQVAQKSAGKVSMATHFFRPAK